MDSPIMDSVLSQKFKNIAKELEASLLFYSINKFRNIIRPHKNLSLQHQKNIVYKILCKECDASYVGQTSRKLMTRIKEHKNYIQRTSTTHSVITNHKLNCNHDFDWDNVMILDKKHFLLKRLISEMLNIIQKTK